MSMISGVSGRADFWTQSPSPSSSEEESSEETETIYSTPKKCKLAREVLREYNRDDIENGLLPEDDKLIEDGIGSLATIPDTPTKKFRATKIAELYGTIVTAASPNTGSLSRARRNLSAEFHRDVTPCLLNSSWFGSKLDKIEAAHEKCENKVAEFPRLPKILADVTHIFSQAQGKSKMEGFHVCFKDSDLASQLQKIIVNSATRVFSAEWDNGKGGMKYSTFFRVDESIPKEAAEEALLEEIVSGKELASQNDRSLHSIPGEEPYFYEVCKRSREGREVYKTTFPIFSLIDVSQEFDGTIARFIPVASLSDITKEKLKEGTPEVITLKYDELINHAREMLGALIRSSINLKDLPPNPSLQKEWMLRRPCKINDAENPIRYFLPETEHLPSRFIFDFAGVFADKTSIKKGLLVAIPVSEFEDISGCDRIVQAIKAKNH